MPELSILIPARNEEWLPNTVADVLAHRAKGPARQKVVDLQTRLAVNGLPESDAQPLRAALELARTEYDATPGPETEIIVVLDGAWPMTPLPQHPDVQVVYVPEPIGQRAATNMAARISQARYVMKLDAHASVAPAFDTTLIEAAERLGPRVTQIPSQRNLHIYDRVCKSCGYRSYQGPKDKGCDSCGGTCDLDVVWKPRPGTTTTNWSFTPEPKFQYGGTSQAWDGDIADVMSSLGACFFMAREFFWELGGMDEAGGFWGSYGIEVAAKSWLSGGRHVCNRATWFSHFFRVGGIGFPYPIHGSDQQKAREYSKRLWYSNGWAGQVRPLRWLVEKFWPVNSWTAAEKDALAATLPTSVSLTSDQLAGGADPLTAWPFDESTNVAAAARVATLPPSVLGVGNQFQMDRVRAVAPFAEVVDFGVVVDGDRVDEPRVREAMRPHELPAEAVSSVSGMVDEASPKPASSAEINLDVLKERAQAPAVEPRDREKLLVSHASASADVGLGASPRSLRVGAPSILPKTPTKAVVYYSDVRPDRAILEASRRSIEASGLPIIAVTLQPIDWPAATNIALPLERGVEAMFKQILVGLIAARADVVFFAEHDCLYHPSHFTFTPPDGETYFYNLNTFKVDAATGRAVHYRTKQTSGLCASRQLLIDHYRKRVAIVEQGGFSRKVGFEPGSHHRKERIDDVPSAEWWSDYPNIDIRHTANLTASRWSPDAFRDKRHCQGWAEADEILGWGRTRGRFADFLAEQVGELAHA